MTDQNKFLSPGVNVLIDGQWGSTGKGKLGAFLADQCEVAYATADFQPNAGHTTIINGKSYVLHTIPSGFVNRDAVLYLSPASTLIVKDVLREIEMLEEFGVQNRLRIHPHACIVSPEDTEQEQRTMGGIASTMKGTGAALSRKIARKAQVAKDIPELARWISDEAMNICRSARRGATVLSETAQGFDLSINHGHKYPYVTSRDVTTANVLANVGVPPQLMSRCWASMRVHPIRVGHYYDKDGNKVGDSGPFYKDQKELTWDQITEQSGSPRPLLEKTTVTKRVRRIFTWSDMQFVKFLHMCQPTDIFLNFVNYLDIGIQGARGALSRQELLRDFEEVGRFVDDIRMVGRAELPTPSPEANLLGTGPDHLDMLTIER